MSKNTLLVLAITLPLFILGAGCATQKTNTQSNSQYRTSSSDDTVTPNSEENDELAISAVILSGVKVVNIQTGTSTLATQSYEEAVALYDTSGTRFQIIQCSINPKSITVKQNVKFMIDNRDNQNHQLGIGTTKYSLAPYNFAIITIQKTGSFNITCDGAGETHVEVEN